MRASPHNSSGAFACMSSVLVNSNKVRFILSASPLWAGVEAVVLVNFVPLFWRKDWNPSPPNSPPPSLWNLRTRRPVWACNCLINLINSPPASDLFFKSITNTAWVNSSVTINAYRWLPIVGQRGWRLFLTCARYSPIKSASLPSLLKNPTYRFCAIPVNWSWFPVWRNGRKTKGMMSQVKPAPAR